MRVSQKLKAHTLSEFDIAIAKLKEQISLDERLYYFSATFGAIYRVMNTECSTGLIFLHHALNIAHTAFQARIQAQSRGVERPIEIDQAMVDTLIVLTENLRERISEDQDSTDICVRLINLSYATTGNGYYLYKKGELTL